MIVGCALLLTQSCVEKHIEGDIERDKYTYELIDSNLIYREYFDNGNLKREKWFRQDTIAEGVELEFDSVSNQIKRWIWFDTTSRYPLIIVYYDSNGHFNRFRGMPFISSGKYRDGVAIQMVNPLNTKYLMGYRDFYKGNLLEESVYEPGVKGNTSWVTLDSHKFEPNHKYFLYYYFVDSNRMIIDSASVELLP